MSEPVSRARGDTLDARYIECARPTGGSHGRTTDARAQRGGRKVKAALWRMGKKQRGQRYKHYKAGARKPRPSVLTKELQ
jgi:hypothetical protein